VDVPSVDSQPNPNHESVVNTDRVTHINGKPESQPTPLQVQEQAFEVQDMAPNNSETEMVAIHIDRPSISSDHLHNSSRTLPTSNSNEPLIQHEALQRPSLDATSQPTPNRHFTYDQSTVIQQQERHQQQQLPQTPQRSNSALFSPVSTKRRPSAIKADEKRRETITRIYLLLRGLTIILVISVLVQIYISYSAITTRYTISEPDVPPTTIFPDVILEGAFDFVHMIAVIIVCLFFYQSKTAASETLTPESTPRPSINGNF